MTTKTDDKKRIVLSVARPGDIFDIQDQGAGRVLLVRLERPKPRARMSRAACLRALASSPLHPKMGWSELKSLTREP